jgi:hypothetical protein
VTWLYILVEGDTELGFVKQTLAPHLEARSVFAIPIEVMTKRERDGRKRKGGGDWTKWKADILRVGCRGTSRAGQSMRRWWTRRWKRLERLEHDEIVRMSPSAASAPRGR